MVLPSDHEIDRLLATPVGRRTLLLGSVRRALGLSSLLTMGSVGTLATVMSGCVRAPGTARDQFIYISEEKEMAMGVGAYRELLRKAPVSDDPELNELVNRVGNRIAAVAKKPNINGNLRSFETIARSMRSPFPVERLQFLREF